MKLVKTIIFTLLVVSCASCVTIGDNIASLRGHLNNEKTSHYSQCRVVISTTDLSRNLLEKVIVDQFEINFTVSPVGGEYLVAVICTDVERQDALFTKVIEIEKGESLVELGVIPL